jgi:serine/threonine-protein kinase RsbW
LTNVRLHLSSRAENVGLAREVLAGLAETVALSREQYDDMRTAVTEACNNVVQHAYEDEEGPLELELRVVADAVEVVVRDQGVGMADGAAEAAGDLDIGLPVMLALADRVEVGAGPYGGTEVSMRFLAPGVEAIDGTKTNGDGPPEIVLPGVHASTRVAFSSAELAVAILPRIAASLAARAHFSTDRVSDVQLISDAIATAASRLTNGPHLEVALATDRRRLDMQIGPLRTGGAERLQRSSLPAIERLADEASVTAIGPDEVLVLSIHDRP